MPPETSDFGTFGRFVETPPDEMDASMRDAYEFTKRLRGLVPGPHKIWVASPDLSKTIVPTGAYFQTDSSLTKAEIEIATTVVCAMWRAEYAIYEHEWIGTDQGRLDPVVLQRIAGGLPVGFDDAREQVVYELSCTLAARRVVSTGMFHRARGLLEDRGIVDLTVLMGWFSMVSLTLNAFDVPMNATGLEPDSDHDD